MPRFTGSSSSMSCIARTFGAPVTVPAGEVAPSTAGAPPPRARRASTLPTPCQTREEPSPPHLSAPLPPPAGAAPVPPPARHDVLLRAAPRVEERASRERALERRGRGLLARLREHQRFGQRIPQARARALEPLPRLRERVGLARICVHDKVE